MSAMKLKTHVAIAGIDHPVIMGYFEQFNAGNFQAVSQLFAIDGALQPPFEAMVVGPDAIAVYLEQEATGFQLHPQAGQMTPLDNGCTQFDVQGHVQTPWFNVKVCWTFILSPTQEIFIVRINLLASLKELLPLRQFAKSIAMVDHIP